MREDAYFLRIALQEAKQALEEGEVPVGAVIVMEGQIVARDHNRIEQLKDPTAHAEILCITAATNALQAKYLPNATLYVTLEPCAMCASAASWAQLGTIVYAASDPEKGFLRYSPSLLHPRTLVRKGLFAEEALSLLHHFFHLRRK
ncbi:MAG: nucleoside deaminase [Bacteroidia bacterium]|nr:nucleoside deaminase [Bacteroidia bacterium]MDW8133535.1 nucleoside deaminase [Bacteroidia bacterium]